MRHSPASRRSGPYPLNFVAAVEYSGNCSLKNIVVHQDTVGHDFTTLGNLTWLAELLGLGVPPGQYQVLWDLGLLPPTDFLLVSSEDITLISNMDPYCSIHDTSDTSEDPYAYNGVNLLRGSLRRVYGIAGSPPDLSDLPQLSEEEIEALQRALADL